MKKIILALCGLFLTTGAFAQTFVDTTVTRKNALIEEFTGKDCGYCPAGHQSANEVIKKHPENVFTINIHQGGFANGTPNYKTSFGDPLANLWSISGWPAGVVSRRNFSGMNLTDYTTFLAKSEVVIAEDANVNIAAKAVIDAQTRLMTITVEAYYTGDIASNLNLLNIALLQDNVIGPQKNYGNYNLDYVTEDGQYRHMHMLRHLITGQWGDSIKVESDNIPQKHFFTHEYKYTLPQKINDIPLRLGDLSIVLFITNGDKKTVLNASHCTPSYINLDANIGELEAIKLTPVSGCNDFVLPTVDLKSYGHDTIKSAKFIVSALSVDSTYTWEASEENLGIATFESKKITLPLANVKLFSPTNVTAKLLAINGEELETISEISASITKDRLKANGAPGDIKLILKRDKKGSETTWTLKNSNGEIVNQGGPYQDTDVAVSDTIVLTGLKEIGCYTFEILDSNEDGINGNEGIGFYKIVQGMPFKTVYNSNGKYGKGEEITFSLESLIGLSQVNGNITYAKLYPNPAKDNATLAISLSENTNANISVVDMIGRTVVNINNKNLKSGENTININTSSLVNGMYLVKIATENAVVTKKININK